jgi:hypothetical protein
MEKRIRLHVDTEESLRRAVYIRAGIRGIEASEVINELIREHLAAEVSMAEKAIAEDQPAETGRGKKGK